jgi:succinate dehydrogenase / fumarate reductase cytochrome b subunit
LALWSHEQTGLARKLFSLTGVVPLGAFVVLHVALYARALGGREALERALPGESLPFLAFEVVFVWLPLAYHALYGSFLALSSTQSLGQAPYVRRSVHLLQRLSGLVVLVFIVYHAWQLRAPLARGSMTRNDLFFALVEALSSTTGLGVPLVALGYLVAMAATAFHFARGLLAACSAWGVVRSERSIKLASWACGLLAVGLFWLAASTVIYLATGSRIGF